MLAPTESQDWHKKFLQPRLVLRVSGGWDDPAVLFADDALVAGGTIDELTQRMSHEFGSKPGDLWFLERPHRNDVITLRRRTQAEIDAGVEATVEVKPLNNSENDQ